MSDIGLNVDLVFSFTEMGFSQKKKRGRLFQKKDAMKLFFIKI